MFFTKGIMPVTKPCSELRDQAITDLIESVALQETALSHILNAEGEKMQAMISMPEITPQHLLALNNSVQKMLGSMTRLEIMLQTKLEMFSSRFLSGPGNTGGSPTEPDRITDCPRDAEHPANIDNDGDRKTCARSKKGKQPKKHLCRFFKR